MSRVYLAGPPFADEHRPRVSESVDATLEDAVSVACAGTPDA